MVVVTSAVAVAESNKAQPNLSQNPASSFSRGLLWKIEKPGTRPSVLFGTIHLSDPRVTKLPDVVSREFSQSKSFTMEIMPSMENMQRLAGATMIRDGKNLEALVGPRLFPKVASLLEGYGIPS